MKALPAEDSRSLAAQYLRKHLKQLIGQFEGIREAASSEPVHRARVASRRLRAALRLFRQCFPKKTVKRWRKEISRLTEALGGARDKDVQLQFLYDLLLRLEAPGCAPGIVRLLAELEQARDAAQPVVLEAVERLQASGVLEEMNAAAKSLTAGGGVSGPGQNSPLLRHLAETIGNRLEAFLSHQECLTRPQDTEQHHAMRIDGKRLRYTIEICKPAYGERLEEFLAAIKEVQRLLGEIHDCDVWSQQLTVFLRHQRSAVVDGYGHDRPLERLQAGIDYVAQQRQRRRCELFQEMVAYWQGLREQALWDRFLATLSATGDSRPEKPTAAAHPADPSPNGPVAQPPAASPDGSSPRDGAHLPAGSP